MTLAVSSSIAGALQRFNQRVYLVWFQEYVRPVLFVRDAHTVD